MKSSHSMTGTVLRMSATQANFRLGGIFLKDNLD